MTEGYEWPPANPEEDMDQGRQPANQRRLIHIAKGQVLPIAI
ncbi:hypothetical protein [Dictyobacter kobayashii]|nr:hypothetical protein [Dictyobacter kobayashii]